MSTPSNASTNLQAQTDLNLAGFVKTELELAFTFSAIAATEYEAGNPSSAKQPLGGHLKTGQSGTPQNRPVETVI